MTDKEQAELAELKKKLEALSSENEALKAAGSGTDTDLDGLKKNRDDILKEKKKFQKELESLKKAKEEADNQALIEQKKFQELYEQEKDKRESLETKLNNIVKVQNFEAAALSAGVAPQSLKYVKMLMSSIDFDDDGKPLEVETVFTKLKEESPFFFQSGNTTANVPFTDSTKTNITRTSNQPYTRAQIKEMSTEEYDKNRAEIKKQEAAGLIR